MEKIFRVNGKKAKYDQISKLHKEGYKLICDDCESELLVALTLAEANQKGIIPGIYCPKDGKHLYIHIYTREARDKMHQLFGEIDRERDKRKK